MTENPDLRYEGHELEPLGEVLYYYLWILKRGLQDLARYIGFDVVGLRYIDLLGVLPRCLSNTVGGVTEMNSRLIRIYDACCVPVTRAIEAVVRPQIGKNLILVARRTTAVPTSGDR